jgi:hypothetical protein
MSRIPSTPPPQSVDDAAPADSSAVTTDPVATVGVVTGARAGTAPVPVPSPGTVLPESTVRTHALVFGSAAEPIAPPTDNTLADMDSQTASDEQDWN